MTRRHDPLVIRHVISAAWTLLTFVLAVAFWSILLGPTAEGDNWGAALHWTLMLATWLLFDLGPRLAWRDWKRQRAQYAERLQRRWASDGEAFHP